MKDFLPSQEPLLVGFWNLLITALELPTAALDLSREIPGCIVDLSQIFDDLLPNNPHRAFASRVPVFLTTANCLLDPHFTDRITQAIRVLEADDAALVFVLPFVEQDRLEARRADEGSRLRIVAGQHMVIFGREDLGRILASRTPRRELRTFVLSQIDITYVSPYTTAGRVPDRVFFGREPEMREISDHIVQVSYAVVGGRRIGKTSMLRRLSNQRLPNAGFQTLYLDCSSIASYDELKRTKAREWNPPDVDPKLRTFGDLMQTQPANRQIVILLDEVDKLLRNDRMATPQESWPLCSEFRSFSNNGFGTFVLAGERILREVLNDSTSPLFNFVKAMRLGPLDFHAVEELVVRPMRKLDIILSNEDAITRRVWDVTSGHPAVVQRLCNRLVTLLAQRALRKLTLDEVDEVVNDPKFVRDDFLATYLSRATVLEHLVVLLMAQNPLLDTGDSVHQALQRDEVDTTLNQVLAAMERLVDLRNMLHRTEDGYSLAVPAVQNVISTHKRLPEWIRLRREIFRHAGDILPEYAPEDLRGDLW